MGCTDHSSCTANNAGSGCATTGGAAGLGGRPTPGPAQPGAGRIPAGRTGAMRAAGAGRALVSRSQHRLAFEHGLGAGGAARLGARASPSEAIVARTLLVSWWHRSRRVSFVATTLQLDDGCARGRSGASSSLSGGALGATAGAAGCGAATAATGASGHRHRRSSAATGGAATARAARRAPAA